LITPEASAPREAQRSSKTIPKSWQDTLYISPNAPWEVAEASYKRLAKLHHPDVGGNLLTMKELNLAFEAAKRAYGKK
jgi:DnaJ-class molecular chaperone